MIHIEKLKKVYGKSEVLKGVSLLVRAEEECVIIGASGSGKSTLLHIIAGLDRPTSGLLQINGMDISKFNDDKLSLYRNRFVGLVFQFHYLLASQSGLKNLMLPAEIAELSVRDKSNVKARVNELAKLLGVEDCLEKYPYEMSGGEQQRLNLIRALSLEPKLLLCDEPTGNLDSVNGERVTDLLLSIAKEFKTTLIVVTHNEKMAARFKRQILMADGMIFE